MQKATTCTCVMQTLNRAVTTGYDVTAYYFRLAIKCSDGQRPRNTVVCRGKMKCVSLATNLVPSDPKEALGSRQIKQNSAKNFIEEYAKASEQRMERSERNLKHRNPTSAAVTTRKIVEERVATLGSEENIYSMAYCDCGLFASIITAYNNHWNLRISPEDWWFCVTRRVAIAIDKNAKKDSVRKMFVEHEGKKTLEVVVPSNSIYGVDYSWFFDEISKKITENVRVPEYVDAVTADFSVTTPVQKIVSQITLMSSLQEFFEYEMMLLCGIPGVEMLGTEEDWKRLQSKLKVLRTLLEPIENDIVLTAEWWALAEDVFCKLLATYLGEPDKDWWSRIITTEPFGSGAQCKYGGWIAQFMEGAKSLNYDDFSSGLVTVPLTIAHPSGVEDTAALVAGTLGFTVHENTTGGVPSVKPFQGWSLLLPENSPFR